MLAILKKLILGSLALMALTVLAAGAMYLSVDLPGEVEIATGTTRNVSQYVGMRDGVALAVDVWFPEDLQPGQRVPSAMRATRAALISPPL